MSDFRKWINVCEAALSPHMLLRELKSYEELFGSDVVDIEPEEDDLIKSEKVLNSHGWQRIHWKHPLGIFEWAFINPHYRKYRIYLMDLKKWEV